MTRAARVAVVASALVAVAFGLLTIRSGGAVLFGPDEARLAAGDFVPSIVWFNFLAGFAYVVAGIGLWRRTSWSPGLAVAIAAATALAFAAFGAHVALGGAWEARTAAAMALRTVVWVAIAAVARRYVTPAPREPGPTPP